METNTAVSTDTSNPGFSAFKLESSISFIRPYDPKAVAIPGYRHSIIKYRDTSKGVSVKPAKMCTIPALQVPAEISNLSDKARQVFVGIIEDEQDAIIKQKIEEKVSLIEWSMVDYQTSLDSLTATRVSQRLTKEQIDAWVRVAMVPTLKQYAQEKLDSGAKEYVGKTVEQAFAMLLNSYADKMSRLSAPVPNLGMEQATSLHNRLVLSELDDDIAKSCRAKLHVILNPVGKDNGDL